MKLFATTTKFFFIIGLVSILTMMDSNTAKAQQDARYSQYMFNQLTFNPAYAGSHERTSLLGLYRKQWVNINGAPTTASFSVHSALGQEKKVGLGGFLEYDKIGVHNRMRAFADYAYRFTLGKGHLALGVQGGITYLNSKYSDITTAEQGVADPVFQENLSRVMPNFGVGVFYSNDYVYAGISVPKLINNKLKNGLESVEALGREYRHYFFSVGGIIPAGQSVKIKPSILVKTVFTNAPTQFDFNLNFFFMDMLWLGSSIRLEDRFNPESLSFMTGVQLKQGLLLGYAYDFTLSELRNHTSGSHEVMLGYSFGRDGERYKTPRFF